MLRIRPDAVAEARADSARVDDVAEILTSRSPQAVELRQNSPFAGALPQETRSKVLAAFVRHWHTEHDRPPGRGSHELVDA
ncbi:MAG: hypothetical protein JO100_05470 [Pseudonocardia sp.]|nr:hypothetical protein [Pseudonocardia sp.]